MADEMKRKYTMQDELLTQRAGTQRDNLNDDLALFTAKFPWLDAAFVTSYSTDIDTAIQFPRDNSVVMDIMVLTDDLKASMTEGVNALDILFNYAKIAYFDNKVKERVFGQDQMGKARNDQEKMTRLLRHANGFADKDPYKTDLQTKGYTQMETDNLVAFSGNIETKNGIQEQAKTERPVTTQGRINVHNIVYDRMLLVSVCAKVVFQGDAARIEQYQVYPSAGGSGTATTIANVTITEPGTDLPRVGYTVRITGSPLEGLTDANGVIEFGLGDAPPAMIDFEVEGGGFPPVTFLDNNIIAGETNFFEFQV